MDIARDQRLVQLLSEAALGDERAFKQFYDESSPYVFAIALKMLRDRSAAEDVVQEVFVKVWYRASTYHADRGSVMSWLTSIVRYRAIDMLRAQRGRSANVSSNAMAADDTDVAQRLLDGAAGTGGDSAPMASAIAADDARLLLDCIERLSTSQVQSVSLAFFRGFTHQELSDSLELPLGTIKSRLRRSLLRLKECLGDLGFKNEVSTRTG